MLYRNKVLIMNEFTVQEKPTLTHQGSTQEQGESHTGRSCDITSGAEPAVNQAC